MKRWYVVQTYSGYENSVVDDLISRKDSMGLANKIYQILAPDQTEEVLDKNGKPAYDKKGNKKVKVTKVYPGYIFLEMEVEKEIDDNTWFIIRNTPKVTGFLGSSGHGTKPVPIPQDEMNRILQKIGLIEKPVFDINVGDQVEVVGGPFIGQTGVVASINEEKEEVVVMIELFGRATPNELRFKQVRKLA